MAHKQLRSSYAGVPDLLATRSASFAEVSSVVMTAAKAFIADTGRPVMVEMYFWRCFVVCGEECVTHMPKKPNLETSLSQLWQLGVYVQGYQQVS